MHLFKDIQRRRAGPHLAALGRCATSGRPCSRATTPSRRIWCPASTGRRRSSWACHTVRRTFVTSMFNEICLHLSNPLLKLLQEVLRLSIDVVGFQNGASAAAEAPAGPSARLHPVQRSLQHLFSIRARIIAVMRTLEGIVKLRP